jgi:hypothetical protein
MNEIQPLQRCVFSVFSPRVARSSQPWADRFNPVGIGLAKETFAKGVWHSTQNSEEGSAAAT